MGVIASKGEGTAPYQRFERLWRKEQRSNYPELLPYWTSNTVFSKDPINSYVPYRFSLFAPRAPPYNISLSDQWLHLASERAHSPGLSPNHCQLRCGRGVRDSGCAMPCLGTMAA